MQPVAEVHGHPVAVGTHRVPPGLHRAEPGGKPEEILCVHRASLGREHAASDAAGGPETRTPRWRAARAVLALFGPHLVIRPRRTPTTRLTATGW